MTESSKLPFPTHRYARVLTIAGSDSSGGAGIQADLKTFAALGCYGMSAITALTAQNTQGVRAIADVALDFLKTQIEAVLDDVGVDAVKIGMLHTPQAVAVVAWALRHYNIQNVVLDPVMVATSGDRLIQDETVHVLEQELFPLATVVTPNLDEAAWLLGQTSIDAHGMDQAALGLLKRGAPAILLKGGHLAGNSLVDVFAQAGQPLLRLSAARIASKNVHGTGCTLSSAIAAYLALGLSLRQAVESARSYVLRGIESGVMVQTGHGHGPVNHGFAPVATRIIPLGSM